MNLQKFDVIVVGAGPAGSIAAYHLADRGYQVLIIEKEFLPRLKPCGGGITYRTLELLPFSIDEIIETSIYKFRFSHKFKYSYLRESADPLMCCVMRDKFDHLLVNKAIEKGAELIQGVKVTGFTEAMEHILVHTDSKEYVGKFVIGADGVNSITARCFQLNDNIKKGIGIESEIRIKEHELPRFQDTVHLDWGTIIGGYAWAFPKKDHLSIGVGGPVKQAKYLKKYFLYFLESLNIDDIEILSFRTYPLPFRTATGRIQASRVMVVGDAAGLTDPLTGEGIYYALKSGKMAAAAIMECLEGVTADVFQYRQRMDAEVISELLAAYPLMQVFNAAPRLIHCQLKKRERLWKGFCKVLRGQVSYQEFRNKMNRFRLLWKPMILLSKLIVFIKKSKEGPGRLFKKN